MAYAKTFFTSEIIFFGKFNPLKLTGRRQGLKSDRGRPESGDVNVTGRKEFGL